jgi:hypothetical protein
MVDDNFSLLIIEISDSFLVDGVVILMNLSVTKSKNGVFFLDFATFVEYLCIIGGRVKDDLKQRHMMEMIFVDIVKEVLNFDCYLWFHLLPFW